MEIKLEGYLKNLKANVLEMGGSVEKALMLAMKCLESQSPSDIQPILDEEDKINALHVMMDEHCFKLIARQAPKAIDLRLIIAIIKVNTDLERMGDLARNISLLVRDLTHGRKLLMQTEMIQMGDLVRGMVRTALDAMTRDDEAKAREVLKLDDPIDKMKVEIQSAMIELMKKDPTLIEAALDHILIVRNLERIGDHATNIAEDVIFIRSGKDIRHGLYKEE